MIRTVRAIGAASLLLGAAAVLTGCSALGATPAVGAPTESSAAAPTTAVPEPVASETPVATPTPTQATDGRTVVVPAVTAAWDPDAKALDVSAFITSVIEGDGTCTVTATSGATTKTVSVSGVAASSYTACQAALTGLAAGTYEVTVRYSSATSVGVGTAADAGKVE